RFTLSWNTACRSRKWRITPSARSTSRSSGHSGSGRWRSMSMCTGSDSARMRGSDRDERENASGGSGGAAGGGGYAGAGGGLLGAACTEASAMAYKAVMKPVEGTLLTVSRGAAESAEAAARDGGDVQAVLDGALAGARATLARTPEMLPLLREAGVVDAGGQG